MIDEVHMLTNTAFNAMLKTLEEPPEYLKFVLATTDPQKVPVTVLSRCLQFNLRPMAPETVLEHLTQRAADRERAGRAAGAAPAGARRARLDARRAVADRPGHRLRQRRAARGRRAPDAGQRRSRPCVPPDRGAGAGRWQDGGRDLGGAAPRRPVRRLHAGGNDGRAAGAWRCCRPCLRGPSRPIGADPDAAETARLAALLPADETQLLYSLCLHGRGELGLAPDEYAALTMVLLRAAGLQAFQRRFDGRRGKKNSE